MHFLETIESNNIFKSTYLYFYNLYYFVIIEDSYGIRTIECIFLIEGSLNPYLSHKRIGRKVEVARSVLCYGWKSFYDVSSAKGAAI